MIRNEVTVPGKRRMDVVLRGMSWARGRIEDEEGDIWYSVHMELRVFPHGTIRKSMKGVTERERVSVKSCTRSTSTYVEVGRDGACGTNAVEDGKGNNESRYAPSKFPYMKIKYQLYVSWPDQAHVKLSYLE